LTGAGIDGYAGIGTGIMMETTSRALPWVSVSGGPYERGLQHGRQCGDLIARYADVLLRTIRLEAAWRALAVDPSLDRKSLLARCLAFLPQYQAFAPHLVEEMRGIADGAKLDFAEVLLVNTRAEVMGIRSDRVAHRSPGAEARSVDGCTAFALGRSATANTEIVAGQNLDQDPANADLLVMLRVEPDDAPPALMCTFAGLVGYPGINAAGIAVFQNALSTSQWRPRGMPHYLLKRVLLEQVTLAGCMDVLRNARLCSSTNYVLADRNTVLAVETTPDGIATVAAEKDVVVHANHFADPVLAQDDALLPGMPDSACRASRLAALIAQSPERPTAATMMDMLADHDGHPASICRHEPGFASIASLVAEADHARLHVTIGNPCQHTAVMYEL
jgi:isopenicillin-N N-acyltransferase-like protein